MDRIETMTCFVRVAERGSFSVAASDLNVSQPHITRAIQQLESRLGAKLLHRTTRRLGLTEEGREYLERARVILASIEEAEESVGSQAKALRGKLRVFAPVSLGRAWIVPHLTEFMERHPELEVKLVLDDHPRDLIEERLDVGVRVGPIAEASHRIRKLGEVERLVVAAPKYWEKHGRPTSPQDLSSHEWLIFDGPVCIDSVRWVRGSTSVDIAIHGRFSTNSSEAIQEAMLLGYGVCLAPYWLIAKELRFGLVERALPEWRTVPTLPLYAVYPETRSLTEKVRRFIDWLIYSLNSNDLFTV
jgi:DNA-binding transcriptional LysR family regulator